MTLQSIILLVLIGSVFLFVFATGLRATTQDATYLIRNPGKLFRAFFSMNIVMPLLVVGLISIFNFDPTVKIILVALAVAPISPTLPSKLMKEGGTESYAVSLMITAALLAVVTVPLTMEILERVFNLPLQLSPMAIVPSILIAILVPVILGIVVHHFAPTFAERIAGAVTKVGAIGLLVTMLAIWINAGSAMWTLIGNGTVLAFAAFVIVGSVVGHFLGGPKPEDRTALAIATASRHPGIALAIATVNFPDQKLASAAVLLYLLVAMVALIPYLVWNKKQRSSDVSDPEPVQPSV